MRVVILAGGFGDQNIRIHEKNTKANDFDK